MKEVSITSEFIKLDQFLKWAGVADTGSSAKALILDGMVKVNGEVTLQRGKKLYEGDRIIVDDREEFIITRG